MITVNSPPGLAEKSCAGNPSAGPTGIVQVASIHWPNTLTLHSGQYPRSGQWPNQTLTQTLILPPIPQWPASQFFANGANTNLLPAVASGHCQILRQPNSNATPKVASGHCPIFRQLALTLTSLCGHWQFVVSLTLTLTPTLPFPPKWPVAIVQFFVSLTLPPPLEVDYCFTNSILTNTTEKHSAFVKPYSPKLDENFFLSFKIKLINLKTVLFILQM